MNADFALLLAGLPERCGLLEECVLTPGRSAADAFDELFRNVHSLKGLGGTFGLSLITSICHQFESFVSAAIKFIVWARIHSRSLTCCANKFAPTTFNHNYFRLNLMAVILRLPMIDQP